MMMRNHRSKTTTLFACLSAGTIASIGVSCAAEEYILKRLEGFRFYWFLALFELVVFSAMTLTTMWWVAAENFTTNIENVLLPNKQQQHHHHQQQQQRHAGGDLTTVTTSTTTTQSKMYVSRRVATVVVLSAEVVSAPARLGT